MALEVKKRYPVPHKTRAHHTLPQRTYKREQRKQSIRRLTTSLMVLLVLALAGGIGYTWYMGKHKVVVATQAPTLIKRPELKPVKASSIAPIGVATQMLMSPVKAGENSSITVKTNPEADCTISVTYNNVPAKDGGLTPKPADEFGIVSWAWTVAPGTPKGTWPVWVSCKNKKNSAVVRADLVVQ
jgi:hypothetical protein